jgi:hypothetical protein
MGVLESITKMKEQGIPEEEIVTKLQEQRIPPKKIHDALEQSKIKQAVSDEEQMQPSIMQSAPSPSENAGEIYTPKTQEEQEQVYAPQQNTDEYYPQENYESSYGAVSSTDTIIEIAEQVFSEKIKKIQTKLEELNEFKTLAQVKLDNATERLKRMETIIDNLQISILDRVGSYGKNIDSVKKEMAMMQDVLKKKQGHTTTKKVSKK